MYQLDPWEGRKGIAKSEIVIDPLLHFDPHLLHISRPVPPVYQAWRVAEARRMYRGQTLGLRALPRASLVPSARQQLFYARPVAQSLRLNSSAPQPPNPGKPGPESNNGGADDRTYNGELPAGLLILEAEADVIEKLRDAAKTPTRWYPIPIALGALVLLAVKFRKEITGGGPGSETFEVTSQGEGGAVVQSKRVDGPWQVCCPSSG